MCFSSWFGFFICSSKMMAEDHDCGFASLPVDVVLTVLSDFLGGAHRDISSMDIACAPTVRDTFIAATHNPTFFLGDGVQFSCMRHFLEDNYAHWLDSRLLQLQSLSNGTLARIQSWDLDSRVLRNTTQLILTFPDRNIDQSDVEETLRMCPSLQSVKYSAANAYDNRCGEWLVGFLTSCAIPLRVFQCGHYFVGNTAALLTAFHSSLKDLDIRHRHSFEILAALETCKALTSLTIDPIPLNKVDGFLASLPSLNELTFFCGDTTVEVEATRLQALWQEVAPKFSHLVRLTFWGDCYGYIPVSAFRMFLQACPNVREIAMFDLIYHQDPSRSSSLFIVSDLHRYNKFWGMLFSAMLRDIIPIFPSPLKSFEIEPNAEHIPDMLDAVADTAFASLPSIIGIKCISTCWNEEVAIRAFSRCTALKHIGFGNGDELTDEVLFVIAQHCKHLEQLDIARSSRITDEGVVAVVHKIADR